VQRNVFTLPAESIAQ